MYYNVSEVPGILLLLLALIKKYVDKNLIYMLFCGKLGN